MVWKLDSKEENSKEFRQYLGSTVTKNGELDKEISHQIQKLKESLWGVNWSGIQGMNVRIEGKIYKTVIRPAALHEMETWA